MFGKKQDLTPFFKPLCRRGEDRAGPFLELALPLGDRVGMDRKLFRQLR